MALQSSGRINLKQIATEYTDTAPHNMSEFYNGGTAGVSSNLIPSSGAIYFSDFYGATASTVVDSSAETILLVKATGSGLENDAITYQNSSDASTGFTETGKPQAGTFSPYRSGGYSTYFDGTGDYISFPASSAMTVDRTTTDYTLEFWIYELGGNTSDFTVIDNQGAGGAMQVSRIYISGNSYFYHASGSAWTSQTDNIASNEWIHFAFVSDATANSIKLYKNGVLVETKTTNLFATVGSPSGVNNIGRRNDGYYDGNMYIRDLRWVIGSQVYTSDFTPPTEPLTAISGTSVLACHLPYIADGSTNNHTFTVNGDTRTLPYGPYDYSPWTADDVGGSVYFDGTGDDLTTASSSDFAYGTGDFTWEAWIYVPGAKANHYVLDHGSNGGTMSIANTKIRYYNSTIGIGSALYTTGGTITYDAWHHVAFVRSSGTTTIYVDGAVGSSASDTHNYGTQAVTVGDYGSGGYNYLGYVADLRIVKGTAIYTSAFTPPTAPLSHTGSGTSLLMNNKSDANIYDAAAGNVLVSIDDIYGAGVRSNTTPRKFTTSSSMFFSGDGSYLLVPTTESLGFGTGDFTWEFWIWSNGMIPSYVLEFGTGGNNGIHYPTAEGHLSYYNSTVGIGSTLYTTGFSTFDSSTWMHIAASRVNGTTYLFKDGTLTASASDSHNYGTSNALYIGTYGATPGSYNFPGRMQDIRITKGRGRYTSSFTAPTAEFSL